MPGDGHAPNSFAVPDLQAARAFHGQLHGLATTPREQGSSMAILTGG